ncbi:sensor histidine kinase [Actinophytocola oryzae]|uniref:histidine kinase n=1 Tax=Actinophytocola oryzae TaxID=502181 RepID=A0A4R7V3E9_9PSEU|nr:ATP-binding protein [Actinophytocola oryzae]TDV43132.1 histidine kinase/DNA gyrase B/HSP90-like ATPase [Actinophytocola oryzae]
MTGYLFAGMVTVLFGIGVWAAFTEGVRRGRAMEQSRADQRIQDTALPALDAIAVLAGTPQTKQVAREYAAVLRRNLGRKRRGRLSEDLAGVVAELSWHGIRTRLELDGLDERVDADLPAERRSALREAIGAALHNTARHSGVRDARVTVETRDGGVAVTARDSGAGFDLDDGRAGFGIGESIVGRMAEVGGTATIESRPGRGTRVTLWVPA